VCLPRLAQCQRWRFADACFRGRSRSAGASGRQTTTEVLVRPGIKW
jgi:hypothetical protein